MTELPFDVVEQILVGMDVKDLIRCKSVCKSWRSFISSPSFVKAHLNHAYNNDRDNHELGHRRMSMPRISSIDDWIHCKFFHIVGSCNGLVCISPTDVELAVINPSTRQEKKLQTPPYRPDMHKLEMNSPLSMVRQVVCWGFGYDSSADDYKVIAGFTKNFSKKRTRFYVLTLKSNIWKVIGEFKYTCVGGMDGVLCGGALHWFMRAAGAKKKVIISFDLSTQEFSEIPQPTADEEYECDKDHELGVIEECLCIYSAISPLSTKKWVMRNNYRWELYDDDRCENKYDVVHLLTHVVVDSHKKTSYVCTHDDGTRVPSIGYYICTSIFVKSLVSPHVNRNHSGYEGQKRNAKQVQGQKVNKSAVIRKRKRYCKHKRPLVWI